MRLPTGNRRLGQDPLLKVGVILMIIALALTTVAVVVTFALRAEPERAVASGSGKASVEPLRYGHYSALQPPAEKPESQPRPSSKPAAQPKPEQSSSQATQQSPWPMPTKEQIAT